MKKLVITIFVLNFAVICGFWWVLSGTQMWSVGGSDTLLIMLGRLMGLLAVYFALLQLMLIGRVAWIERVFGFDRLAIAHRWFGFGTLVAMLLHVIFLAWGYGLIYQISAWQQFVDFNIKGDELLPATFAVILFVIVMITSITIAKKRMKYEVWYYVHLLSYVAILMAFGHQLEMGYDLRASTLFAIYWIFLYSVVGVSFVYYRFIKQFVNFRKHNFFVSDIVEECKDVVSVYIKGNNIGAFEYRAGQFIMVRFLTKKLIWQAHPFSISSVKNDDHIRITAKNLGDFSKDMKRIPIEARVLIDGPLGKFTMKENQKDRVVCIGGGVGITPIRPLAEDLLSKGKNVVILYSIRTHDQIIFQKEFDALQKTYGDQLKIHYIISQEDNGTPFKRINQTCVECLIPDVAERDVYMCGPTRMIQDIKTCLIKLGVSKKHIFYEKFSF